MRPFRTLAFFPPLLLLLLAVLPTVKIAAQERRALDHYDYGHWNSIDGQALSADGTWLRFALNPHEGDGVLRFERLADEMGHAVPRGTGAAFTSDARFAVFRISPESAAVKAAREARNDRPEAPSDSLGILDLHTGALVRIARVRAFRLPSESSRWLAYHLRADAERRKGEGVEKEETPAPAAPAEARGPHEPAEAHEPEAGEAGKREKTHGTPLVLRDLRSGSETRYEDVTLFHFTPDGEHLVFAVSTPDGSGDGLYVVRTRSGETRALMAGEGEYRGVALDRRGTQVAFLSNRDEWRSDPESEPSHTLYHAAVARGMASAVAAEGSPGVPAGWWVSPDRTPDFSNDGTRLYFGTAPRPAPAPAAPPPSDRVEVDVWSWHDPYIQPMQLLQADQERRRSYLAVAHLGDRRRVVQLATERIPVVVVGRRGDADHALGTSDLPYRQLVSWDGRYTDSYLVDVRNGRSELVLEGTRGSAQLSPSGRHIFWWDGNAGAWFARGVEDGRSVNLTERIPFPVLNELDDRPQPPGPHGLAGWTRDDGSVLVYDRHDIWMVDPSGARAPRNLTAGAGRENDIRFRWVRTERDRDVVPLDRDVILSAFHYRTKAEGFYGDRFTERGLEDRAPRPLLRDDASFSPPTKAEKADVLLFTRQTWNDFPDLHVSDLAFRDVRRVTDANPQVAEYRWGSAELTEWVSVDGTPLQGILYKPDDFDPSREYPMMVHFYERLSHNLHTFHVPAAGRASISFPFYVSRDYLLFVPDIPYKPGFPGESAMNAVVPGVLDLVSRGFVDRDRIGVQGHSWGGYQIAYMLTKTNLFRAAEAGAPVVNMTSAYGGIRWASGMVRQFQYEQTQSRIGGTLWDAHLRYIENSPLFEAYKVETPLIMMHNDKDGAVPWEQGIEFFVALRRLGKPVWMLNYNGEGHGLTGEANRRDFAIRMQQFFDHYLQDAPPPVWMVEGVPAVRKGLTLGLELVGEEEGGAVVAEEGEGGEEGRDGPEGVDARDEGDGGG